ncbi:MAG: hypothetical protein JXQ26_04785 [Tissierellales bacterium]|nr:hypothetical protein [Tissierellales bacterium]MBN2827279.1 hypothetical protein [Tissierellales bacterium]
MEKPSFETLKWKIDVPIFKNRLILNQLMIAIGIPFGLLLLFLSLAGGKDSLYAIALILSMFLLTFFLILILFKGKYSLNYLLDEKGLSVNSEKNYQKKSRALALLTVFLSIFSKNPTAAGAGILSQTRHKEYIRWHHITKVKYYDRHHTILIKQGLFHSVGVFCTDENYPLVQSIVASKTENLQVK